MKIKMQKKLRIILACLLFSVLPVKLFAGVIDTTKYVFILDDKRVPAQTIINGIIKGNIKVITQSDSMKDALRRFWEKYRYGLCVYKTRKEGE